MKRIILIFPRDLPGPEAFSYYEVYEFEGTVKELLVECARISLKCGSRRTFTHFFVLHQEDWYEVLLNLDRYKDFYYLTDLVIEPDMNEADKIARDLGIRSPTLLYMAWEPETFICEEIRDLVKHCTDKGTLIESMILTDLIKSAKENPEEAVGVDFAFLNFKDNQKFAEICSDKYFAFLCSFKKFMIAGENCNKLRFFDSIIFDCAKSELELYQVLSNLVK